MDSTDWLLTGLLTTVTGGFLWLRPVIEIPARLGVWMVLAGFLVGVFGVILSQMVARLSE